MYNRYSNRRSTLAVLGRGASEGLSVMRGRRTPEP